MTDKALVNKNNDYLFWFLCDFGMKGCLFTMPQHHLGSGESGICALAAQTLTTDESHLQLRTH